MYFDNKPCQVCGSKVELRAPQEVGDRTAPDSSRAGNPAGVRAGGGEHEPDGTVDERICTNRNCPTNRSDTAGAP